MATTQVATKEGNIITVEHREGASEADILRYAIDQYQRDPSVAVSKGSSIASDPDLDPYDSGEPFAVDPDLDTYALGEPSIFEEEDSSYDLGLPLEMGKASVRGFGGGLLSSASGLAELADIGTDFIGLEDLIDSGDENEVIRLANEGKQALNEYVGVGDRYKDNYLVNLSEAFGSIASAFVPAAGVAGLVGKGASTATAIGMGVGLNAADQADRVKAARERGETVSEGQEDAAIALSGLFGGAEAITPLNILKKIRKFKDPKKNEEAFNAVRSALYSGLGEGLQEVGQSLVNNAIEDGVYAEEGVNYGESLWDDFTVGAGAGALLDAATTGVYRRRSRATKDAEIEREQQFREEEAAASEAFYDRADRAKTAAEMGPRLEAELSLQQEQALIAGEAVSFDPLQPYEGSAVSLKDRGAEYARQLARGAIQQAEGFPDSGKFEVIEEKVEGGSIFKVEHSSGTQFGEASPYRESSVHLMANLNQEIINRKINSGVLDALDIAPESYTPEQAEGLYSIGQKLNRPKRFTVTSAVLNEAGDTTFSPNSAYQEDKSIDQLHVNQYGFEPLSQGKGEPKLYKDLRDLTVAQEINLERRRKGQPEVQEFTLEEAKQALGDKYPKLFDVLLGVKAPDMPAITEKFGTVGARLAQKRIGVEEINTVLAEKNISSSVTSPELQYVFEKIVNESDVGKMTPAQRVYLVQELKKFPIVGDVGARPSSLPDFRPKPYTKAEYDSAIEFVTKSGDGTLENIESNLGSSATVKRRKTIATALHKDLKKSGLIDKGDNVSAPPLLSYQEPAGNQPYKEDVSESAKALEESLSKGLSGIGLDDIRLRVLDELKAGYVTRKGELILSGTPEENLPDTEGYFFPPVKTVFLALDKVETNSRDQTPEAKREALVDILNHEVVHAVRFLDLWKDSEWRLLENLAKTKIVPGTGNVTFFNKAQSLYTDKSAVEQMEEGVAELIRYGHKDKKLITGKPRSLVERMYNFFEKTGSALRGTGFQSFSDVMTRLESGELGSRKRGEIRTLKATEKRMGAVPERGIGLAKDVREPKLRKEIISRRKIEARKQGFNINDIYYHGTDHYNRDRKDNNPEDIVIRKFDPSYPNSINTVAGFFSLSPRFSSQFAESYPEDGGGSPAVYPVYLRVNNPFDAGRIYRDNADVLNEGVYDRPIPLKQKVLSLFNQKSSTNLSDLEEVQLIAKEIKNPNHPYYKKRIEKVRDNDNFWPLTSDATDAEIIEVQKNRLLRTLNVLLPKRFKEKAPLHQTEIDDRYGRTATYTEGAVSPSTFGYNSLGLISDFIDSAGFDSYIDYETDITEGATGIAVFDPSNIKGVFAKYDPSRVPEGSEYTDDIMFSRKRASSPEGMTSIDLMPTEQELGQMKNGTYKPKKKRKLVDAAQFLQDRWEAATGRTEPFEYTAENKEIISDMLAQEAIVALDKDANAIGWYDRKIKAAKKVMSLVEPRIMASPESEARFDFGLAVTSNGQAVVDNFEMATKIFRYHEKNGRFPETKKEFDQGGERNAAMLAAFKFHNAYERSGQNQPIREFLDEDYTVRELSEFALDFNAQVGFEAIKVPSSEGAGVEVKASYILGPKIGQGFYQNIRGNYDPLTMDIWWMRMWNRAVGRPFKSVLEDEVRNERRDAIKNFMKKSSGLPRKLADEVLKGNDQTRSEIYADPELFDGFIVDLNKRYQKYYKQYKEDKGVNHVKPQIFQKTGTYVKNMAPLLQATPKGVEERAYMREVVELARDRLKESNYDITTADFQALMWYPEKQLFRALGVAPGRGSDNDYLDAAEALAEKEGVSLGRIEKTLRDADGSRANNDQPSPRGQDGSVRVDASGIVGQEESSLAESRARDLNSEILESRIIKAEESAAEFAQRYPENTLLGSLDRSAQVQKDLVDQETMGEPFEFQTKGYKFGRKFVYWVADKFVGLKGAEKDINDYRRSLGLNPLKATESAYIGEESISGILGDKMREFEFNRKKPLAKKIAESKLSLDEIDEFLIMRHAIERNERIASRDETRDVETQPGSGMLKEGQKLSNSFVKRTMKDRYDMEWNSAKETWSGGNLRAAKLNDIAKDLDQIINETLDNTVEGGLIEPKVAENIRGIYNYYSPMRGKDIEDDYAESIVIGSGLSTKGKEFMRAMGRDSAAKSPLGHILLNAERAMSRGTKNKQFGQRLVNLVKNNPDETFWRVISPEDPKYSRAFERKFTYIGSDKDLQGQTFTNVPEGSDSRDYIQKIIIKKDNPFLLDKDLLGVKVDGKQVYVEIADKRLLNAIAGMDGGTVDNIIQKFGLVNRWLSMMNTALSPEFVISNFTKDIQAAVLNILGEQDMTYGKAKDQALVAAVLKDVVPSMGVFYKAMQRYNPKDGTLIGSITGIGSKDAADVREFLSSGAKADWFHTRPPEDQVKTIQSMIDMANGGFKGNFKKGFESIRNFVEDSNSAVENAVRLATFKASRDQLMNAGVSRQEAIAQAASLAKNLTINFNRKGMGGDLINAMYLFFNASVQGTANFGRGLVGPRGNPFSSEASRVKQGAVTALIGFGALSALKAEEESEENPETGRSFYSEIPEYIKERNMIVMHEPKFVPGKRESNTYITKDGKEYLGTQFYSTIPLPYGYNVFHVLGRSLFEMTNDHVSPLKAASNVTSAFLGSFSPVPFSSPLPTIFTPLREIDKNENFFGGPIYRENFPTGTQVPESQLSMASTKPPFIAAAKAINTLFKGNEQESGAVDISPDVLEHLAEFALGGAGQFYMRSGNAFEKWAKGEELKTREIPFLRKIKGEADDNLSLSDFYERKRKLEQKAARIEFLRGPERIAYRKENSSYIQTFINLEIAEERLRTLRKRRKLLREKASRSPAAALEAAAGEEMVYDQMNSAYNKFNKAYDLKVGRTK